MDVNGKLPPEQEQYARWLDFGTKAGLAALVVTFLAYAFSLFEPLVPHQEMTRLWRLPLAAYLQSTGAPTGWGWMEHLGKSDYVTFIGIAVLALVTAACYLRMIPTLLKGGERLQAALAILQVLVLLAAASGLLAGGH